MRGTICVLAPAGKKKRATGQDGLSVKRWQDARKAFHCAGGDRLITPCKRITVTNKFIT